MCFGNFCCVKPAAAPPLPRQASYNEDIYSKILKGGMYEPMLQRILKNIPIMPHRDGWNFLQHLQVKIDQSPDFVLRQPIHLDSTPEQPPYANNTVDGLSGSLIELPDMPKIIAAQFPHPNYLDSFFNVVRRYEIHDIVVLSHIQFGSGYYPAFPSYWPMSEETSVADFSFVSTVNDPDSDYQCINLIDQKAGFQLRIHHHASWPEAGVPDKEKLIRFMQRVDASAKNNPILVHCTAGKQRTGAFIGSWYYYKNHFKKNVLIPCQLVALMRTQRPNMVGHFAQYILLYDIFAQLEIKYEDVAEV